MPVHSEKYSLRHLSCSILVLPDAALFIITVIIDIVLYEFSQSIQGCSVAQWMRLRSIIGNDATYSHP